MSIKMKKALPILIIITLVSCQKQKTPQELSWEGSWQARWLIAPVSPTDLPEGKDLYMNGIFDFKKDSLTITAQGFANCVFGEDTLSHTQGWLQEDSTLYLLMPDGSRGIQYKVKMADKDKVVLQLLEDITITLTR